MNFSRIFFFLLAAAFCLATAARAGTAIDKAAAAIKAGQFVRADDILSPLAENRHAEPAVFYYLSLVRLAQKRTEDAVTLADRAAKAEPSNLAYCLQLGSVCTARIAEVGPMDGNALAIKMRKAYERALTVDPTCLPALTGLVFFYEHAPELVGGNIKKAGEVAERIRKTYPYQGEVELGKLAAGQKNFESALAHYDAAAKLNPDDLATATACGWTLVKLGRKDEARERFQAVLKVDPNFDPAKMGLTETAPAAH